MDLSDCFIVLINLMIWILIVLGQVWNICWLSLMNVSLYLLKQKTENVRMWMLGFCSAAPAKTFYCTLREVNSELSSPFITMQLFKIVMGICTYTILVFDHCSISPLIQRSAVDLLNAEISCCSQFMLQVAKVVCLTMTNSYMYWCFVLFHNSFEFVFYIYIFFFSFFYIYF